MTIEAQLCARLSTAFSPSQLEVINESGMHNVPPGSESHFKVTLVSQAFAGKRPIARHREVYAAVDDLMAGGIHALALHTYTEEEWLKRSSAPNSPNCRGGEGSSSD